MSEPCLFCKNNSGSRGHLCPKGIHERVDFGPLRMDRYGSQQIIIPDPEKMVAGRTIGRLPAWLGLLNIT